MNPFTCLPYKPYDPYLRAALAGTTLSIIMCLARGAKQEPPFVQINVPEPLPDPAWSDSENILPSDRQREDRPEVNLPPQMGLGIALGPKYEVGESSAAAKSLARPAGGLRADYGFVATMDMEIRRDPERYVGYGITDSWKIV
ncbi:hypothetical protein Tco_0446484 [Tanacetum coccineum]